MMMMMKTQQVIVETFPLRLADDSWHRLAVVVSGDQIEVSIVITTIISSTMISTIITTIIIITTTIIIIIIVIAIVHYLRVFQVFQNLFFSFYRHQSEYLTIESFAALLFLSV